MVMHSTNYRQTFIRIAPDSKVAAAEAPPLKEPKSAVRLAYEMLIDSPYRYTSDDVLYETVAKPKVSTGKPSSARASLACGPPCSPSATALGCTAMLRAGLPWCLQAARPMRLSVPIAGCGSLRP